MLTSQAIISASKRLPFSSACRRRTSLRCDTVAASNDTNPMLTITSAKSRGLRSPCRIDVPLSTSN